MDSIAIAEVMGSPLEDNKNDNEDSCTTLGHFEEVMIKTEIENDEEEFSEIAVQKQKSIGTPEQLSLLEGDPPDLKIFVKKEECMDDEYEGTFEVQSKKSIIKNHENYGESHCELKIKCKYCFKMFDNNSLLNIHLKVHKGEKSVTSKQCQKSFSTFSNSKVHSRTHTQEKPYTCEHCQKSFTQLHSLKIHLRIHSGEKPYKCEHCQKHFSRLDNLKSHIRTHTGEKPYTCEHCQKSFWRRDDLKIHLETHTGEKPFSC